MAIISSKITRDHDRGNGTRSIHEEHLDDLGKIHEFRYQCLLGFDSDAALLSNSIKSYNNFIYNEKEIIKNKVISGIDPILITSAYIARLDRIKIIISTAMQSASYEIIKVAEIAGNITDAEIDDMFGSDVRIRIRDRVSSVLNIKPALDADNLLIESV